MSRSEVPQLFSQRAGICCNLIGLIEKISSMEKVSDEP